MRFLLLGKGKTTQAIAQFLKEMNQNVDFACKIEEKSNNDLLFDNQLLKLKNIDYVIKSPGISEIHPVFRKIKKKFKVISELDLFYLFQIETKVIAITGSNGKTTCVHLIEQLLKNARFKVLVCGNSHLPIFSYKDEFKKLDYLIVELSSFQLENLTFYHPHLSTILNLSPNHLDSVRSLKSYYQSKMNIYRYADFNDYFIYNPAIKQIPIHKVKATIRCIDPTLFYKMDIPSEIQCYKTQILVLYEIKQILNIDLKTFLLTLNQFHPLPFRQQQTWVNDILFINDSKSTSVDSAIFAFKNIPPQKNIILIIGGKDKKLNYKPLKNLSYYRLVVYGQIKDKVSKKIKNIIVFDDLEKAFKYATSLKIDKKVILFSPATSSFDQYQNYQERGYHFEQLIQRYRSQDDEE